MGQNQVKRDAESPESTPFLEGGGGGGGGGYTISPDPNTNPHFPLHMAACSGDVDKVKELLLVCAGTAGNSSPSVNSSLTRWLDESGRTPLHCATHPTSSSHNLEVIQLLLQRDKEDPSSEGKPLLANLQDASQKTALHYAAASQEPRVVSLLLLFGADPNLKDSQGSTPLHILAESNSDSALECAKLILHSPSLISPSARSETNAKGQTPVHIATQNAAPKLLGLFIERGFDFASHDHIEGHTPLMVACSKEDGGDSEENLACVRILLDASSPEQVNAKTEVTGEPALFMAANQALFEVLKLLISSKKTDLFIKDKLNYTVFHFGVMGGFRGKNLPCVKLLCECEQMMSKEKIVEFIFNSHKLKTQEEAENWMSPIEIAVYFRLTKIVDYLLAAHPRKDQWMSDEDLMSMIYSRLPTILVPAMNESLKYNSAGLGKWDDMVEVDFRIITGDKDPIEQRIQETKFLYQINQGPGEVQKVILLNPLVQMFLDRKWERIRELTWIHILVQLSWIVSYTLMVYEMYAPNCHSTTHLTSSNQTEGEGTRGDGGVVEDGRKGHMRILHSLGFLEWEDDCRFHQTAVQSSTLILYVLSTLVLAKEVFQLRMKSYRYFWDFINLTQLGILVVALVNSVPAWQLTSASELTPWQTNLAAGGIFVAWVTVLREVDNIPHCGVYSAILRKVFLHCLKMLLFYSPLLIGFAMCLRILTPGKGQYNYLLFSLIKVVVMMTGELDFEDAFYGDESAAGPSIAYAAIFGQIMFLLLVFVTTIVLLNLLTGLAVADVGRLLEEADVHRLSVQLERMYMLECLILWTRNRIKWFDSWRALLYRWNATAEREWPYKKYVYSAEQCLNIKDYSAELKARIREVMVAAEE